MTARVLTMWVLIMGLALPAQAQWTNEPAGATTVLDCPFSQLPTYPITYCGIENFYHAGVLSTESVPQMVSPGGAFKSALAAGQRVGGSQLNYVLPSINREMFVGMKWRTNPEFQGRTGGNKTFFMRGPDSIGVFVIQGGLASGSGPFVWSHNSGATHNEHTCSADLGLLCYPNVGAGIVQRGVWTTLEAYIKASTTNTSRDGIVRWWINGVLAGNYTNINYAGAGLNEWIWTETWDGCGGFNPCDLGTVNTAEWAHYIDHLHVSVPNCPAGGCTTTGGGGGTSPAPPPPPPLPPNKPTNLRVQ